MIKCPSCGSEVFEIDRFCRNCGAILELSAIFERWHLADGNYPPFYKGMAVNLSFQVHIQSSLSKTLSENHYFNHLGDAEYDFCGEVIYIDKPIKETPLAVIDVGSFRFYIESAEVNRLRVGKYVKGKGTLLLDYYIWVEFKSKHKNVPDIFYTLEVARIQKAKIPEPFIYRHNKGIMLPTYVSSRETKDVEEIESMESQYLSKKFNEDINKMRFDFFIVDFKKIDRNDIPRTFI